MIIWIKMHGIKLWQLWLCISQFRRFFSKILSLYSLHLKNSGIKKCNTLSHNYIIFLAMQVNILKLWIIFHKSDFFSELQDISYCILREKVQNSYFFPCHWKFTSRNSSFFLRILTFPATNKKLLRLFNSQFWLSCNCEFKEPELWDMCGKNIAK